MKKCLLVLAATLAMSSVAMAAPVTDIEKGETNVGYLYWHPKVDFAGESFGNSNANGFFIESAVTDKLIVGIETIKGDTSASFDGDTYNLDTRFTDITVQYKVADNVRLIAGNRKYEGDLGVAGYGKLMSGSSNKFIYGISGSTTLGKKTTGYASVLNNSYGTDWQIGVNQKINNEITFNVNYRYYDEDYFDLKGIGAGLVYKF